ncbi:MAG: ribonuclease T [Pseudomonadota bacterium]
MGPLRLWCSLFSLVLTGLALSTGIGRADDRPGDFDYYVLAISWSPTFCGQRDNRRRNPQQCDVGRRFSFVVHGLWPQYDRGWPDYCRTNNRYVPNSQIREMLPIMPSKRLIIHEWRKHGTCSGLSQRQYFGATRELFGRFLVPARYVAPSRTILTTPDELVNDIVKTNLWLKPAMISVQCGNARGRARLSEVRVCFSRDLKPVACGHNERRRCRARTLVMPPVR